ncbi:MAB_1171c family putative transporter [Saccharopolyspora shandongensis]|uniref:MAB_1171c family putative transporter n=1 Tax=Saccharopolyspora shandongensis TaxID=418495 RepID=UPI00340E1826
MIDALRFYGPPVAVGIIVVLTLVDGRLPRSTTQRVVRVGLLALGVSQALNTPAIYAEIGRITGVPNVARLLSHGAMLVVVWSAFAFMSYLNCPAKVAKRRSAHHACWIAGAFALMSVLFALAPVDVDEVRFASRYGDAPWVLEYWLVYLFCLAPVLLAIAGETWRYARLVTGVMLRTGLRLIGVGALCALVYHAHKAFFFAANRFDVAYPEATGRLLDVWLPPAATVLVLVGATSQWWGHRLRLPSLARWLRSYRRHLALRPLWLALYRANPQIALVPPLPRLFEVLVPRDVGLRLYRRVIEIRDGRLALQPYLDPGFAVEARRRASGSGVTGQELDAIVEAAVLDAALRAHACGRPLVHSSAQLSVPGGGDFDSDVAFLTEVVRAFRRLRRRGGRVWPLPAQPAG